MKVIEIITMLAYMDDIIILRKSHHYIIHTTEELIASSWNMSLIISEPKIKYILMTHHMLNNNDLRVSQYLTPLKNSMI